MDSDGRFSCREAEPAANRTCDPAVGVATRMWSLTGFPPAKHRDRFGLTVLVVGLGVEQEPGDDVGSRFGFSACC